MRADDFLTEGGLRSWLWKLGKDAVDYAAGQSPKVKNYVDQPKGGMFGGRVPGSADDVTHAYRNMSPEELAAAKKSGYFEKNPNPGKTTWDTDTKYWSQGDTEGYFGRSWKDVPHNAQVRLPQDKLPRWTAGRTGDAEVLDRSTGKWNTIDEMAGEVHGGVRKALMAKGYKYLGSGIDKQAYLEPGTGQVLIVFGYRKGNTEDFSPDQRMFIDWINYCNKNANNPHLPKFSGFESFQFGGQNYIQARMEPLQELSNDVGMLVAHVDDVVNNKKQNFQKQIKNISSYATFASAEEGDSAYYELKDTINYLGGKQAAMNLLKTVYQVKQFARKHQFTVDLHRGNYMARSNGTIVVNDPFVLWLNQ
jgi:hypothetical protein